MNIDELLTRFSELQEYIGWTEADLDAVRLARPLVLPLIPTLVADFYAEIERHDATRRVFTGGEPQVLRLRKSLGEWLDRLLGGVYDADYVRLRWRVGLRHVEIGLPAHWTHAAIGRIRAGLIRHLATEFGGTPGLAGEVVGAVNRLLDIDSAIIGAAYQYEHLERQKRGQRLVAIGQMAGGIAHELRNPLNVIRTSVFYLRTARQITAEKRTEHLERIERQASLAEGVITALSDFAKLPLPATQAVEIRQLVERAVAEQELPARIRVETGGLDGCPAASGDPRQLAIVLGNLIRNARDAMPSGGMVRITARCDAARVHLAVQDTGPGLDPEAVHRIFEPFHSTKPRGMGLGLAMCRAIVENHGGEIRATAAPGSGATFSLSLPRAPTDPAASSGPPSRDCRHVRP